MKTSTRNSKTFQMPPEYSRVETEERSGFLSQSLKGGHVCFRCDPVIASSDSVSVNTLLKPLYNEHYPSILVTILR